MPQRRDFGAIRQLPSGRYQARWKVNGTTFTADQTFRVKGDAQRYLSSIRTRLTRGERVDPRTARLRIGDLVAQHLDNAASRLKPKSMTVYRAIAHNAIGVRTPPERHQGIAAKEIGRLLPSEVDAWLGRMTQGPSYRRQAHRLLSVVCDVAVRDGRIPSNPCKGTDLPRLPEADSRILSAEEVERLRDEMPAEFKATVDVMAWGGLRLGETLALRRSSVDLDAGTLRISENLVEAKSSTGRWTMMFDTPKSHASRTIHLIPATTERLREHLAAHVRPDADALLFPSTRATPMRQSNFARSVWIPATKAAGLEGVTRHDLRRTCASLLLEAGATVPQVQRHLGHKDPTLTLKVYTRLTAHSPETFRAAVERAQNFRSGTFGGTELDSSAPDSLPTPA